jgi:hypothetical protein
MPKYWTYDVTTRVQINHLAKNDIPSCVGLKGYIIDQLESVKWDYELLLDNATLVRVKENEITIVKE